MSKLPNGWLQVSFADVLDVNPKKSVSLSLKENVTFVPMAAVSEVSGTIADGSIKQLEQVNRGFRQFKNGDVLFAKITPSMENGKSAVAHNLKNGIGFGSTEFHILRSHGSVLPEYLWRFIRQESFRENAKKVMSGAVGHQRVPATYLESHNLPLAPIAEQKRIVDKMKVLFARTTQAAKAMSQVSKLVENYKNSFLTSIFNKVLTEKSVKNCTFQSVTTVAQNGMSKRRGEFGEPVNVLRLADLSDGEFEGNTPRKIIITEKELEKYKLDTGDLLCIRVNGSEKLVGRVLTWNSSELWAFCDHFIRYKVDLDKVVPEYMQYYFSTEKVRNIIETSFVSTAGQKTVNQRIIGEITVPIPSTSVQNQIVSRINGVFAWLDNIASEQAAISKLIPLLERSINSKAFKGLLVPQNFEDESAKNLLARVKNDKKQTLEKPSQNRKKDKQMNQSPIERLLKDSENWPEGGLPFEEIAKRNPIPHDAMRDALFSLLAEDSPRLRQTFNEQEECMYLQRVNP